MMSEAHIRAPCGDAAAVFIYTHTLMTEMYDLYGFITLIALSLPAVHSCVSVFRE
jgi:hypothetical protein